MATLANFFDQFTGARAAAAGIEVHRRFGDACSLRALPHEDIYFHVKQIDNSRVVRQADPAARARSWKLAGASGLAAMALICMLLPSAYGLLAGYQLSTLEQEHQRLTTERSRLELDEARLVSPENLRVLADHQGLIDPQPESTVYLQPKDDHSLALNRR